MLPSSSSTHLPHSLIATCQPTSTTDPAFFAPAVSALALASSISKAPFRLFDASRTASVIITVTWCAALAQRAAQNVKTGFWFPSAGVANATRAQLGKAALVWPQGAESNGS